MPPDLNLLQINHVSENENERETQIQTVKGTHKLTDDTRAHIIQIILQHLKKGKPKRGVMKEVAGQFHISSKTVQRFWAQAKEQMKEGKTVSVLGKMKGKSNGRESLTLTVEQVSAVSPTKRRTIRALAKAVSVSKTTIHRMIQRGKIKAHTNPIKPFLTEDNKFHDFYEYVHVDEKWFYMTQTSQRVYLHANEEDEMHRTVKSKKFITKIMFLAASARPQFNEDGQVKFDGKIGIFPFIKKEPAKRKSRNRPRGTIVTKPVLSVTKDVYRTFLLEKVIPAIKEKWPSYMSKRVITQQDNDRPHIPCTDPEFLVVAKSDGFDIQLICQPSNSPDLNVLDLGYFRAIQALQQEKKCKTIDVLVDAVTRSYYEFNHMLSNFVWLSLQYCMGEVIKILGCNAYKIPHVGKNTLLRTGELPTSVIMDYASVLKAQQHQRLQQFDWRQFITEDDNTLPQE